jgi:cytochrome c peroxidase
MRSCHAIVAFVIAAAALAATDAKPVPVPRDSLPAKIPLDAIPLGLKDREVPKDNPLTESRVALGRKLFFDPILSADNTVACASCHQPARGFAGPADGARGIGGQRTPRKAPTLFNRAYGTAFFWDGRETALEAQALRPIEDPTEMGSKLDAVVKRLQADKDYKERFEAAFTDGLTEANVGRALASFERVLLRGDSVVDRFRRKGEHDALTPTQREGLWLYESKARCWRCHSGPNFSDEGFHNTGVNWNKETPDRGRITSTKRDEDRGKFKTPTLRGVSLTAPYMHDGSLATLEDVVEFYNRGGGANPNLDTVIVPLQLSKDEVAALVEFLKAL